MLVVMVVGLDLTTRNPDSFLDGHEPVFTRRTHG